MKDLILQEIYSALENNKNLRVEYNGVFCQDGGFKGNVCMINIYTEHTICQLDRSHKAINIRNKFKRHTVKLHSTEFMKLWEYVLPMLDTPTVDSYPKDNQYIYDMLDDLNAR